MAFTRHAGLKWLLLGGLFLALALMLLSSRAAAAACGGGIKFGSQTSDWIERSGDQCEYFYEYTGDGQTAKEITIAMLGVSLDEPSLALYAPGSRTPMTGADCEKPVERLSRLSPTPAPTPSLALRVKPSLSRALAVSREASISCYLKKPGIYRIVAARDPNARAGTATGQFVLNLCGTHIASPYDETLEAPRDGEIERKGLACYSFEAQPNDCVTIAMNKNRKVAGNTLDPWLDLRDPAGTIIASDDNSNENDNAAIRNFCLKKPGLYTIIARSYDFSGSGPFKFYFTLKEAPAKR